MFHLNFIGDSCVNGWKRKKNKDSASFIISVHERCCRRLCELELKRKIENQDYHLNG